MSKYILVTSNVLNRCIECDLEYICKGEDPINEHMKVDQSESEIRSLIKLCKNRMDNSYIKYTKYYE